MQRYRPHGLVVCFSLVTFTAVSAVELEWPGLLGGWERDGWVDGFEPPASWPEKLTQKWQREVGTGYGSPIVSGDRVYQHARQGEDEVLWCLDINNGDVIWKQSTPVPFTMGGGGEWHGKGPKGCPALADGRIFTMSISGAISAWDTETGDLLWSRDDIGKRFTSSHPYWGCSTSPLVDEDRVIAHFGGDKDGVLVALDVTNGKEVWTSEQTYGASYSSPLLVELDGVQQIVEWNMSVLCGVDRETGKQLWAFPFPQTGSDQNMPTPTIYNGVIMLGAENRGFTAIEPKLENGKWTVKEKWFQKDVALDMSSAVVNDDLLFGHSHYGRGRLFCLDTKTGEVLWQGPGRIGANATFLAFPSHIAALLDNGELQMLVATGSGLNKVASYQVAESPTWAPPVLLKDGILVKEKTKLSRWSFDD